VAPRNRKFGQLDFEVFGERKERYKVEARSVAQMAALQAHNEGLTYDPSRLMKVVEEALLRHFENEGELQKLALLRKVTSQRQRDGINRARRPATMAAKVRAATGDIPAADVAKRVGCSKRYVNMIRKAEAEKKTKAEKKAKAKAAGKSIT